VSRFVLDHIPVAPDSAVTRRVRCALHRGSVWGYPRQRALCEEVGPVFRLRSREQSIEATLKQIEHRVLDEVHQSPWMRRVAWIAAVVLLAATTTVWVVGYGGGVLPLVAASFGAAAAIVSFVTLWRRRFRWGVAAAYLSGLSTVTGIGAYWWCHTSVEAGPLAVATAVAGLAAATLTAVWVAVAITPVVESQPDMRRPTERRWGVREPGGTITWPPPCAGPFRPKGE